MHRPCWLPSQSQSTDNTLVTVLIHRRKVSEKPATLSDQLQQTAPRTVVLGVRLEVIGKVRDSCGEQSNLHLR